MNIEQNNMERKEGYENIFESHSKCDQNYNKMNQTLINTTDDQTDTNDVACGGSKLECFDMIKEEQHQNTDKFHSTFDETGGDKIQCSVCEETYENITEYTHHLNTHLEESNNQSMGTIEITTKKFNYEDQFPNQPEGLDSTHNKMKPFSCTFCDKQYARKSSLTIHLNVVHRKPKPFPCTLCDESFLCKEDMSRHISVDHHKIKFFSCTSCDRSFRHKWALTRHIKTVHRKRDQFTCTLCDKSFAMERRLAEHIQVVHHISCTLCQKTFAVKRDLTAHLKADHQLMFLSCAMPDKSFTSTKHLKVHGDAIQLKLKPFRCTLCDKSFRRKCNRTRHMNAVHYKLNHVSCALCNKSFSNTGDLARHNAAIHGNKMPFFCTLCNKSFTSKSKMAKHIYDVHPKTDRQILTEHMNSVHKLTHFSCTLCKKSFATETGRSAHMDYIHKQRTKHIPNTLLSQLFSQNESLTTDAISSPTPTMGDSFSDSPSVIVENMYQTQSGRRLSEKNPPTPEMDDFQETVIFKCLQCSAQFYMKESLERHSTIHLSSGK